MLKSPRTQDPRTWFYLVLLGLLLLLAACDLGTNSTNSAATPTTAASSPTTGIGNASPTASTTLTGSTPTATRLPASTATPTSTPTPTPRATQTPTPKPTSGPIVTITTDSNGVFLFSPKTLTVTLGTTVVWKNQTPVLHNVISNLFGGGSVSPGGSISIKFNTAGTFAYHCSIHPFMTGTIIVK
jgi:plastocyanin